jgi:RHS repeat-associated protein
VVTTKVYDTAGRVTSETVAGNTTTNTYDGLGHQTYKDDPDDRQTTYTYDLFGHQSSDVETLPGTPRTTVKNTQTTYDSLDRPTQVTDSVRNLTDTYSYPANTAGNTTDTQSVGTSGSDLVQTVLTTGADGYEASRSSTVTNGPNLTRTINSRDNAKHVTEATLAAGQPTSIFSQFSYDAAGHMTEQWGPDTGDGSGFLAAASTTNAYTYSPTTGLKTADNLQLQTVGTAGPIQDSYAYDSYGRLQSAVTNGSTETDQFDANGDLTSIGSGTSLTYGTSPNQGDQLSTMTVGGTTTCYTYDQSHGWRTSQGPQGSPNINFGYTSTGRLSSYTDSNTSLSAAYTYDAAGQRTQSQVTLTGLTTTTNFTYEGLLLQNLSASQSGGVGATSWEITYLYDENGDPYAGVYRQPANSTSPIVFGMVTTDRGDVVELLDAAGNPFAAYRYDAWGNPQGTGNVGTGIWSQNTSLISSQVASDIAGRQVLRYASYCYDPESGLYYLSARSYDPQTRQFLSKDEAKADGEESEYLYCAGDPVLNSDPSGHKGKIVKSGGPYDTTVWGKSWNKYDHALINARYELGADQSQNQFARITAVCAIYYCNLTYSAGASMSTTYTDTDKYGRNRHQVTGHTGWPLPTNEVFGGNSGTHFTLWWTTNDCWVPIDVYAIAHVAAYLPGVEYFIQGSPVQFVKGDSPTPPYN